jgi:hypothetical protein
MLQVVSCRPGIVEVRIDPRLFHMRFVVDYVVSSEYFHLFLLTSFHQFYTHLSTSITEAMCS